MLESGNVSKLYKFILIIAVIAGIVTLFVTMLHGVNFAVLNPKGTIAYQERGLIIFTALLSLVVVIPVFVMLIFIVWRYREGNTKAVYSPDWDRSRFFETLWWGIPCVIIAILGVVTWISSHQLDPYRPIVSTTKPITVQVVALQWKWLFIYPDQHVASVNVLHIPNNTPINFAVSADAPMNSFWIPNLGGQIYAMPGMSTQLHLMANTIGTYRGSSANISGTGFASMDFAVDVSSASQYQRWIHSVQSSATIMDDSSYVALARPSASVRPTSYYLTDPYLYDKIVLKFMTPTNQFAGLK